MPLLGGLWIKGRWGERKLSDATSKKKNREKQKGSKRVSNKWGVHKKSLVRQRGIRRSRVIQRKEREGRSKILQSVYERGMNGEAAETGKPV